MDPQATELVALVEELAAELEGYGERHWAAWLRRDASKVREADETGITHLLAAYGGMGSMSDFRLSPANGHPVSQAHIDAINASLSQRGMRVYELARALQRDVVQSLPVSA